MRSETGKGLGDSSMKLLTFISMVFAVLYSISAYSDVEPRSAEDLATLRQGIPLDSVEEEPADLQNPSNKDLKRTRSYPMQPPTIPHKIDNYQVDLKVNTCLSCHARRQVDESQAPMISVTHFMDRDGNFLAEVSPSRYFCSQCHVTQVERKDLLKNNFTDMHDIINQQKPNQE